MRDAIATHLSIGRTWPRWLLAAAALAIVAATLASPPGRNLLKAVDADWLGYRVTDLYARARGAEDWAAAPRLPAGMAADWARPPVRIAHAMGSWGRPDENRPAALERALAAGFRLIEMDLSYDAQGKLRAFHGPGPARPDDWLLDDILTVARARDFYIVLDLKSDFGRSADDVLRKVRGTPLEPRMIFQLYSPDDIAWFARHAPGTRLPAPIVTLYRARRFKPHLIPNLRRIGATIVTVPIERAGELGEAHRFARLLVHPLASCHAAAALGVDGGYMRSDAPCGDRPGQ